MSKPRQSRSSFSFFFEDNRLDILAEKPAIPFDALVNEVGKKWHALTGEEQLVYINRADDDRERYAIEMEKYVEPASKKAKKQADKDDMQPKKAMSAYLMYTNATRDEMREKNPTESMTGLSKLMAQNWNEMTVEEKQTWNEKAEADKIRYNAEMEEYNFYKSMIDLKVPPPPPKEAEVVPETAVAEQEIQPAAENADVLQPMDQTVDQAEDENASNGDALGGVL